jgi:hypothetical protein
MRAATITTGESPEGRWLELRALPVYHLIGLGLMMVSWILPLVVFGTGIGRYVHTGSVFGFESGSYFYITGLFTLPISIAWACIVFARTRRVRIDVKADGITMQERAGPFDHRKTLPASDIRLLTATMFPSGLAFGLFVPLVALVGFSFQFVIPNLRLPQGSPGYEAGLTLLAFCFLVMAAWLVFAVYPGLTITLFTPGAKYILDMPGIDTGAEVVAWLQGSASGIAKLLPLASDGKYRHSMLRSSIIYPVSLACIVAGMTGLVISISNVFQTPFNQALCWLAFMMGMAEIVIAKHGASSTLASSFRSPDGEVTDQVTWMPTGPVPPFIKFAGLFLAMFFVGFAAGHVDAYNEALLLLAGLFFLAWSIATTRAPDPKISVRLSDRVVEHVGQGEPRTYFILGPKRDRKPRAAFPRKVMLMLFVIAGVVGLLLGIFLGWFA